MNQNREPGGRPTGGRYATAEHAESPVALTPVSDDEQEALRRLEAARDNARKPVAKELVQHLIDNPRRAALALLQIAAYLGSNEEWDSEMIESVAADCSAAGLPSVGDQSEEDLRAYRELADQFGYSHDGPDEDDDDDTCQQCGESLEDNEGYDGYCGGCADRLEAEGHWG